MGKKKILKWIIVLVGFIQIPVLFLPFIKSFNAVKTIEMCFNELGNEWGIVYVIHFIVPVAISIFATLIFFIKSNKGTAIFGILLNVISSILYIIGLADLNDRGVDTSYGLTVNRGIIFIELVLYVVFFIVSLNKKAREIKKCGGSESPHFFV